VKTILDHIGDTPLAPLRRVPAAKIVLADPVGSGLAGWAETGVPGPDAPYLVEGIGSARPPEIMERAVIDAVERLSDEESFAMTRRLIRGGGCSSAALRAPRWSPRGARSRGRSSRSCRTPGTATAPPPGCRSADAAPRAELGYPVRERE
jgi:hypothetical protein